MTYLILLIVGVTLGVGMSHASALKVMKQSIETDFAALIAEVEKLKGKV